jgi:hypothetical protein
MNTTVKGVPAALVPGGLNRAQTGTPQARPAAPQRSFTAPGHLQPMQANRSPTALAQQPHAALMPPRSNSLPPRPGGLDPTSPHAAFNPFAGALRQPQSPASTMRPPAMRMPASSGYPGVSWASMPQPPHASPYVAMPTPQPYRPQPPLQAPNPFAGAAGPGRFAHGQPPLHQAAAPTYAAPPGYATPPRRHSAPASPVARPQASAAQAAQPQASAPKEKFSFTKAMFMSGYLSERYGWSSGGGSRISARMSRYSENHSGPGMGPVEHHSF